MAKSRRTTRSRKKKKPGVIRSAFQLLRLTFFGRILLFLFFAALILWGTMLAVAYDYDKFFMVVGIELVVAAVAGWVVYLIKSRPARTRTQK